MNEKNKKRFKTAAGIICLTTLLAAAGSAGYIFYSKNKSSDASLQIAQLENRINRIDDILISLSKNNQSDTSVTVEDLKVLYQKIDTLSQTYGELLNSKANLASVMGLMERIDSLEKAVKNLNQVTSQGALILTAAGLVENEAQTEKPFIYEAEVLKELSRGTPIEKSSDIIASLASKGLNGEKTLTQRFLDLHEKTFSLPESPLKIVTVETVPSSQSKDWKENIKNKLSELVIIEKMGTNSESDTVDEQKPRDIVYELVLAGDLEGAVIKMNTEPQYQTELFEIWAEEVRQVQVFKQQMAKIKALTLGSMKVQSLTLNK